MVNNQKLENNCIDYDDLVKGIMNLTLKKLKEKELFYTFLLSRTAIERMVQFDFAYTAYEYLSEKKLDSWQVRLEWNRMDVALLENNKEKIIIQLKANQGPISKKTKESLITDLKNKVNEDTEKLNKYLNNVKRKDKEIVAYIIFFQARLKNYETPQWHNQCDEKKCWWCSKNFNQLYEEIIKIMEPQIATETVNFNNDEFEGSFFMAFKVK